ncbi:2'-5' RNA ligase family protein [Rhodococcus daqingensis]|uniref:2'-5' RNA ligase family protein n=1 Tax=Rhodococcus daqingensis TaxID=2479363 RepID=A0ABW2RYR5_9NOCA
MVQSVELLLDDALDDAIRREWEQLSVAGLPCVNAHRADAIRPHITLAVAQHLDPEVELELQEGLVAPDLHLSLGGLVVFGGRRMVLAHLVVPTSGLLSLQRTVFRLMHTSAGIPGHTRPGDWTPHITLARRMVPEQIGEAMRALSPSQRAGRAAGIRRWDGDAKREWRIA